MSTAGGRSTLALLVVAALIALLAVPVLAFADETETPADLAAGEDAAAAEATAPAGPALGSAPALEEAPAEEAAVEESPPVVEEVAAPQASTALASRPSATIGSRVGQRFAGQARARAARSGPPATSKARTSAVTRLAVPDENCSGTVANFGLSDPVVTHNGTTTTTYTWTVTYSGTPENCGAEGVSHISMTPCLNAISGNFTKGESGTYKWENSPAVGAQLVLTFAGNLDDSGNVTTSLKKSTLTERGSVKGPSCTEAACPQGYSLTTGVSPTGAGSIDVTGDSAPYSLGESVSLDVTETAGYTFSGWSGDSTSTDDPLEITFGTDCAVDVTATFTEDEVDCPNGYTLSALASPANAGSIAGAGDNPHAEGSQVELTATPGTGFLFTGWSGDGTGTATRTVSFTGEDCELAVTASFAPEQTPDCSGDFDPTNNGPNGNCTIPPSPDCSGDFDDTNNGPNGDCTIPPTPDCSGDFDPTNNGPNGDCTEPPPTAVDLCPNIEGDQNQIPDGMELNEDGDCVEPAVLPVDVCPNLEGDQAEVPEDMIVNPVTGDCEEDEVLGEIIDRDENPGTPSTPTGRVAPQVQPSRVAAEAGVLPLTGRDLVPFLMMSLLLMAIGGGLTIVRRPAAKK